VITDLDEVRKVGWQIQAMVLRKAVFELLGKLPHEASESPTANFALTIGRPSADALIVELGLSLDHKEVLRSEVVYAGQWVSTDGGEAMSDQDLKYFAAKVAPSILYPFLRETLASLSVKAGLPPLVLPVVNFERVFNPADVAVPPPPGRAPDSAE